LWSVPAEHGATSYSDVFGAPLITRAVCAFIAQ
jgi:hypothetical protein